MSTLTDTGPQVIPAARAFVRRASIDVTDTAALHHVAELQVVMTRRAWHTLGIERDPGAGLDALHAVLRAAADVVHEYRYSEDHLSAAWVMPSCGPVADRAFAAQMIVDGVTPAHLQIDVAQVTR